MRIAVAGGTGTIGTMVVQEAEATGTEAVVVARSTGANVMTGDGLDAALAEVDAVIDVTNVFTLSAKASRDFFTTATTHLLDAERRAGVAHHVALSIVGIDRIDASYYAGKLAQERVLTASDRAHTIVRAAQFHEFAGQLLSGMRGPVAILPKTLMRPVAAREIARYLVDVARAEPQGRAQDLVGPRDESLVDLARRQLSFDGKRQGVLSVRLPGAYGRGLASGSLRGDGSARTGTQTFDEWLRSPDHSSS